MARCNIKGAKEFKYQTGEGVAWNYEESINWRKKLVEIAEKHVVFS